MNVGVAPIETTSFSIRLLLARLRPWLVACCLALCAVPVCVPSASADGDPPSDYLISQLAFLPFNSNISKSQASEFFQLLADSRAKGFSVRVAIVMQKLGITRELAMKRLEAAHGRLRLVLGESSGQP